MPTGNTGEDLSRDLQRNPLYRLGWRHRKTGRYGCEPEFRCEVEPDHHPDLYLPALQARG